MQKLKEVRQKNGYSCEQIAKMVGITKPYYWQIENNQRRLYYQLAKNIANVFNMKPDELFYDENLKVSRK